MSDNYITICTVREVENPIELSKKIINWLQSNEIIEKELSDCIMNIQKEGYRPGENHLDAVCYDENILQLAVCGLETKTEKEVFNAMAFTAMTKMECPSCNHNRFEGITSQDFFMDNCTEEQIALYNSVFPAFDKWIKNEEAKLTCPHCNLESEIGNYVIDNSLSLSNLGFTFWNWPELNSEFISKFQSVLGVDIKVINGHM